MVVIASPPKSDSCGLISSRLLLQTFTLLLLCNHHHGKKFWRKGTISDYTLAASAQVKVLPKKNPYVYFRLKDALMDRRSAKQGKSKWTGKHEWAGRMDMGVALRFPVSQSTPGVGGARIEFPTDSQRIDALTTNYP